MDLRLGGKYSVWFSHTLKQLVAYGPTPAHAFPVYKNDLYRCNLPLLKRFRGKAEVNKPRRSRKAQQMSDTKSEGFKWFGEGFDGFPKRLPEDCIEYAIYVIDNHGGANKIKKKTRLRQVEQEAIGLSRSLLKDYIWQREAFSLNLNHEDGRKNVLVTLHKEIIIDFLSLRKSLSPWQNQFRGFCGR